LLFKQMGGTRHAQRENSVPAASGALRTTNESRSAFKGADIDASYALPCPVDCCYNRAAPLTARYAAQANGQCTYNGVLLGSKVRFPRKRHAFIRAPRHIKMLRRWKVYPRRTVLLSARAGEDKKNHR